MYLSTTEFLELNENKLKKFLELKIKEDQYLDYKLDLSSVEKRKSHKEFLKDVTAFANGNGGQIFIGVKEPNDDDNIDQQLCGINKAKEWSQDLERLSASSIDPRISGLKIKTIDLSNGHAVIVIHISASLNRPHMVNYDNHRTFYMRHSESTFPMNTNEIRNAVMFTMSIEKKVKKYLKEQENDFQKYFLNNIPTFLIQAIPLIPLETEWDVSNAEILSIIRGDSRSTNYYFDLRSLIMPKYTLYGIMGSDNREKPNWQTEIHRSGYVSLFYRNQNPDPSLPTKFILHSNYIELFNSYLSILTELSNVTKTDVPYLISCKYFGANQTRIYFSNRFNFGSNFYEREIISFPLHYRSVSEPFVVVGMKLMKELFNAYGYKDVLE